MKSTLLSNLLVAASFALLAVSADAERLASPTMGFIKQSPVAKADTLCGLPLHRTPSWAGAVSEVSANTLTLDASLEASTLVSTSHYVLVTSGALQGCTFPVSANTATTVTVSPNGGADLETQGFQAGDQVQIIAYWTLGKSVPRVQ